MQINSDEMRRLLELAAGGGEVEVRALAIKLNKPIDEVRKVVDRHRDEMMASMSTNQRLQQYLSMVHDMAEIAYYDYKGEPDDRRAKAAATLVQTAQDLIKDIEGRKDSKVALAELVRDVVQPLLKACITYVATEVGQADRALADLLTHGELTSSQYDKLKFMFDNVLDGFGMRSRDGYANAVRALGNNLGVDSGAIPPLLLGLPGDSNVTQLPTPNTALLLEEKVR